MSNATQENHSSSVPVRRLPPWLKRPLAGCNAFGPTKTIVAESGLATVCQEAKCPNQGECWGKRHATFMILGDVCTRRCRFCAVKHGEPMPPAVDEPQRLAQAVEQLGLRHVVITSVSRDDLADEGASHFAECVTAVRDAAASVTVEVLPADFHARQECIARLCQAKPHVYNHNIEMVERLTPTLRPQANYRRSLNVLSTVKSICPEMITKSGLMVGLGETHDELLAAFKDLRAVGCDALTIGQYLAPTRNAAVPVQRYYTPEEFDELGRIALSMRFLAVASGPFVRSSYDAQEVFSKIQEAVSTDAM